MSIMFYNNSNQDISSFKKKSETPQNLRLSVSHVKHKGTDYCLDYVPSYFYMSMHTYMRNKDTDDKKKQVNNKTLFTEGVDI